MDRGGSTAGGAGAGVAMTGAGGGAGGVGGGGGAGGASTTGFVIWGSDGTGGGGAGLGRVGWTPAGENCFDDVAVEEPAMSRFVVKATETVMGGGATGTAGVRVIWAVGVVGGTRVI